MKIAYCHDHTENADAVASIARILADRLGDCAVQLCPPGTRAGLGHAHMNRTPSLQASGSKPQVDTLPGKPEAAPQDGSDASSATPACTRLIVTGRDATCTTDAVEQLALSTHVPALLVHDPAPILAWLRSERVLRVLCAHDLTPTADDALRFIKQLRQVAPCKVVVAHVHRSFEERTHAGCTSVGLMRRHDLDVWRALQQELHERTRRILGNNAAEIRVNPAPLRRDNLILELVDETGADLVITGMHPPAGSGRLAPPTAVSLALLRFASASIMLVPAALAPAPACAPSRGIRRVLVVTDLTPTCQQAIRHGHALLGQRGTLRLVHVLDPDALPDNEYDRNLSAGQQQAAHARLVKSRSSRLRALALSEASAPGVITETEMVEHRDPAVAIAQAAERFDADVVCLAMHERPTFLTSLFRSKIRSVLARSNRPLLIVQPPES